MYSDSSGDESTQKAGSPPTAQRHTTWNATPIMNPTVQINLEGLPRQPVGSSSSLGSSTVVVPPFFPWWQVDMNPGETLCYHGNTKLADGRQGLLVDPGAWSNLAGENWTQDMSKKAMTAGHNVAQGRLSKPMTVAGVGRDTDRAEWEVHMPIALLDSDGVGLLHEFRVPVIGGEGANLPALLGLQSMSRQNAVLEMAPGAEYLKLPGPGGYTVTWPPGTVRYKLEKAKMWSSHLTL